MIKISLYVGVWGFLLEKGANLTLACCRPAASHWKRTYMSIVGVVYSRRFNSLVYQTINKTVPDGYGKPDLAFLARVTVKTQQQFQSSADI